ncbi:hypothetical protein [Deinococcus hohokamensis]|uniref:Uncharacterized protein n=1 Tax=Deinococcus hohokamensis TaxID=309883 RepID=A0ABV9I8P7_9DEIO
MNPIRLLTLLLRSRATLDPIDITLGRVEVSVIPNRDTGERRAATTEGSHTLVAAFEATGTFPRGEQQ